MEYRPDGELRTRGAAPLNGMLYVVITNVADAFVTPAATALAVALHDTAHPQVLRCTNDCHRSCAFRRERKYIGCARFLYFQPGKRINNSNGMKGEERSKTYLEWLEHPRIEKSDYSSLA
jgi:hypothetical protein